jgi:hypothetical protein
MYMSQFRVFAWIVLLSQCVSGGNIVSIENEKVLIQLQSTTGGLVGLVDKISGINLASDKAASFSAWNLKFVDSLGELRLAPGENITVAKSTQSDEDTEVLSLTWSGVTLYRYDAKHPVAAVNVNLDISLPSTSAISEWDISFEVVSGSPIGLWEAQVSVPLSIGSDEKGELFYPTGFGVTFSNPIVSTGGSRAKTYPCGEAAMQFMALGNTHSSSAAYVAALDVAGEAKVIQYSSSIHNNPSLSFTIYPENAGMPLSVGAKWSAPYSIAVGVVSNVDDRNGRPLWHEAGMIYRDWVLKNADWTHSGPISSQPYYPSWYTENSVWLNTHWQCHDIFNETGGDPQFVLSYTTQIAERLQEPSLALHWYEWQQGPDPAPEARYKFDTHYPDYFPARTDFAYAVEQLSLINVSSFPYINGRISDVNSEAYLKDNGSIYCSKKTDVKLMNDESELIPYVETYGSNASFCVTNPFTSYWQDKIADTVEKLVSEYNVAGVYIDQIASAVPKLCWDSVHEHTLGGGDFWTEGYTKMMIEVQSRLKNTYTRPMVTEDNAEPYMNSVQGYLTLNAFKHSMAQSSNGVLSSTSRIAPAFPLVYGGYYVGFGAIWNRYDFSDHDWWCSKLGSMFITGSQLGWFSLIGIDNDPQDSCGPMGVGDLMLDSNNDDLINFLRVVARSRYAVVDYLVHGSITRPPVLSPEPTVQLFSTYDYDTVVYAAWKKPASESILVLLAGCTTESYEGNLVVNFSLWNFSDDSKLSVSEVLPSGERKTLGNIEGPSALWPISIVGRSVLMLEFNAI